MFSTSLKILIISILATTSLQPQIVRDRDGNIYKTVTIGNKVWLAENLNTEIASSYCYDNNLKNCKNCGRLYSQRAAEVACSLLGSGWRLPESSDWEILANRYGGFYDLTVRDTYKQNPKIGFKSVGALRSGGKSGMNIYGCGVGVVEQYGNRNTRFEGGVGFWTSGLNKKTKMITSTGIVSNPVVFKISSLYGLHKQSLNGDKWLFCVRCVRDK